MRFFTKSFKFAGKASWNDKGINLSTRFEREIEEGSQEDENSEEENEQEDTEGEDQGYTGP